PRARVPLVVGELQVGHHRPVPVRPPRLPQVHAYTKSRLRAPCRATRHKSCAYTISPIPDPLKPLTRPNPLRKPRICLRTAEVRPWPQVKMENPAQQPCAFGRRRTKVSEDSPWGL